MKKENLINEITRISTLMNISNRSILMNNLLNENKIILNEGISPAVIKNFETKIISLIDRITAKESKNLNLKFDNLNLPTPTRLSNLNEKFAFIIENYIDRGIQMPEDVTEFVVSLIKNLGEKDEVFAKEVASELLVGFESLMKSGKLLKDNAFESFNSKFGKNITNILKSEYRKMLFNSIDSTSPYVTDIKNLTLNEITALSKSIKEGGPIFYNSLPKAIDRLIISVESMKKLMLSFENPNIISNLEAKKELTKNIKSNMLTFAKTYHNEVDYLMEVLKTHSELTSTSDAFKVAYKTLSEIPQVFRKLEVLSKSTGNEEKYTFFNNLWIGFKNAFSKANKGVKKATIKTEFDSPNVEFDKLKENVGYLGTYLRILGVGVSKGLPGAKFNNPLWHKALMQYGRKGVTTQVISEMVTRMFKYQLLFTIINLIIGVLSNFKFDDKVLECEDGCDKKENQDKDGNIIKIPKECISTNSFTQFLFLRTLKYHRFTDDNALKRSVIDMGQDIMGSSSWGQATKFIPGLVDDIIVFLSETNVSDTSPTKEEKKEKHKEWVKRKEAQLLELLNTLNNETKKIVDNSEEIPNDSNNDSNSTIVTPPETNTITTTPVVYANNEPSFIEFLKNQNPPQTYQEGSYSEDKESGKNSDNIKYYFDAEHKIFTDK
jgi:hypothetical protein